MKILRKLGTTLTAIVLAISMTACQGSNFIGKVDGFDIRHGIYLYIALDAIAQGEAEVYNEESSLAEANSSSNTESSDSDTSEESVPFFKKTIGEKTSIDWVNEKIEESLKQYVAVEKEFERLGLTLSEDNKDLINNTVESTWNSEYYYEAYGITFSQVFADQGITTKGDYYEKQGISEQSYKQIITNAQKKQNIFDHYYAKGGEKAVSDADKLAYFKENYTRVKYIAMSPDDQNIDDDEKALEATKKHAEEIIEKLNNGEKFSTVSEEYDAWAKKQNESENDSSNNSSTSSKDEDEEVKTEDDYDRIFKKDSTSFSEEFMTKLFSMTEDGKAQAIEENGYVMVVLREDISKRTDWLEDYDSTILVALKNEEFYKDLNEIGKDYSIEIDDKNRKKYAPDKIKVVSVSS